MERARGIIPASCFVLYPFLPIVNQVLSVAFGCNNNLFHATIMAWLGLSKIIINNNQFHATISAGLGLYCRGYLGVNCTYDGIQKAAQDLFFILTWQSPDVSIKSKLLLFTFKTL
jgi:hypothetical protein